MTWDQIKHPLAVTASLGTLIAGGLAYLNSNYVSASDFRQYRNQVEQRILTQQKQQLESDILKLEVKKQAYPDKFDAVDKAVLEKQTETLKEVKKDLSNLREAEAK